MLDTPTKKRIDDCRDILVGKLPDPKAQIEQITIALIYKFMDDMDKEAVELGAKAKFFSGNFEKYSWDSLFDTKVTANEMLALYSEAITSMDKNPNIPQLFRDIFKNAFLPYRDPETLKLFLKTIGEFEYTHSEKLGDAFEYLLSVMGSQGDAGQFRTPRHIIDFLVAAVDPQKTDTILDPACGTAGFLISAFKHITAERHAERPSSHSELVSESLTSELPTLKQVQGDPMGVGLTPDERRRIISNFTGYDISPDMVRLSLVNLYLHGFSDPHIWEYDTLSSEDRWNETFDVILANPPFMSPKGGIRPHKKFSISSNRSEVLFVDYIAEHLNPKGRAGIIVPEGVIFQSGTAYKDLRKMLVENYLYAVVSLPAGVFNPYSGVKTSILLMDKEFAKTSEEILFVKIDNDGYGLGAQRNAVKGGQLEQAIEIIKTFRSHTEQHTSHTEQHTSHSEQHTSHSELVSESLTSEPPTLKQVQGDGKTIAHAVPKSEIAKNGDYNLSGERYKTNEKFKITNYELVELGDLCELVGGGTPSKENEKFWMNGNIKWISSRHIDNSGKIIGNDYITIDGLNNSSSKIAPKDSIIFITRVSVGKYAIADDDYAINQDLTALIPKNKKLYNRYLLAIAPIIASIIDKNAVGIGVRGVNRKDLSSLQIPLPPISVQQEIVAEIEDYQKIIDGAKMVVENYKPKIDIDPEWEIAELGEVCEVKSGGTPDRENPNYWNGNIPYIKTGQIFFNFIYKADEFITQEGLENSSARIIPAETILMAMYGQGVTRGRVAILKIDAAINQAVSAISANNAIIDTVFLYFQLQGLYEHLRKISDARGGNQSNLNSKLIKELKIIIPPLDTQRQIVAQIEKEQELINGNKQLIEIFEQKIKDRIAKVWGEDKAENKQDLSLAAEPIVEYKTN